ncbi:hypothetical protein G7Y89_g4969 [Cudoniella acicularis]|uniref:Uncharacterized protein n=1 Tax=Cudoniella acicularis TaxID=354080 RepID=A0A8H4RND4_9HELO|nr:hypothetical protein G7Y89_g4969 [Cudoniella acicularis]
MQSWWPPPFYQTYAPPRQVFFDTAPVNNASLVCNDLSCIQCFGTRATLMPQQTWYAPQQSFVPLQYQFQPRPNYQYPLQYQQPFQSTYQPAYYPQMNSQQTVARQPQIYQQALFPANPYPYQQYAAPLQTYASNSNSLPPMQMMQPLLQRRPAYTQASLEQPPRMPMQEQVRPQNFVQQQQPAPPMQLLGPVVAPQAFVERETVPLFRFQSQSSSPDYHPPPSATSRNIKKEHPKQKKKTKKEKKRKAKKSKDRSPEVTESSPAPEQQRSDRVSCRKCEEKGLDHLEELRKEAAARSQNQNQNQVQIRQQETDESAPPSSIVSPSADAARRKAIKLEQGRKEQPAVLPRTNEIDLAQQQPRRRKREPDDEGLDLYDIPAFVPNDSNGSGGIAKKRRRRG